MTKSHISVKDTSQTVEEAGKTDWIWSSPPPSLVSTSSKPPGPGWVGSRGEIVTSGPGQWWPKMMTVFSCAAKSKFQIWYLFAHGEFFQPQQALIKWQPRFDLFLPSTASLHKHSSVNYGNLEATFRLKRLVFCCHDDLRLKTLLQEVWIVAIEELRTNYCTASAVFEVLGKCEELCWLLVSD